MTETKNEVKSEFNLIDHIKLPYDDDSINVKMLRTLLTPSLAKHCAKRFRIGKEGIVVYGQIITMATQSSLLGARMSAPDALTDDDIVLADTLSLNKDTAKAFVYVWSLLNRLFDVHVFTDDDQYSLKDLLYIIEWMNYFNLDMECDGYNMFMDEFNNRLGMLLNEHKYGKITLTEDKQLVLIEESATAENKCHESKFPLDQLERTMLEKMYYSLEKRCIRGVDDGDTTCAAQIREYVVTVAEILGQSLSEELKCITMRMSEWLTHINTKMTNNEPLTDIERRIAIRRLNARIASWATNGNWGQPLDSLACEAGYIGVDIPYEMAQCLHVHHSSISTTPSFLVCRALRLDIAKGFPSYYNKYLVQRSEKTAAAEARGALVSVRITSPDGNVDMLTPEYPLARCVTDVIKELTN